MLYNLQNNIGFRETFNHSLGTHKILQTNTNISPEQHAYLFSAIVPTMKIKASICEAICEERVDM